MPGRISWLDILNIQAEWVALDDIYGWLGKISGRQRRPDKKTVERFNDSLNFIREQLTHMHFNEPLDVASLNERLGSVRLEIAADGGAASEGVLPALRARAEGTGDDEFLMAIEKTVLFEFASTVGEYIDDPERSPIERCAGIYKEPDAAQLSPAASFDERLELRWREEIPALKERGLTTTQEIQRCIDFFPSRPKARYCSDECRFRTFQLVKQLSEPDYLAEKQRRYRSRQQD